LKLYRFTALILLLGMAWMVRADAPEFGTLRQALPDLRAGPHTARATFVEVAVAVLADRFLAAAGASQDNAGWARGTRVYVANLWRAVDAVHAGGVVSLIEDKDGSLRVVISGSPSQQFALLPPQPHEREAMEAQILGHLCKTVACRALTNAQITVAANTRAETGRDAIVARFAATSTDGDGLSCATGDGRHGRLRAGACARLLAEASHLATVLDEAMRDGQGLDWSVLSAPLWRKRGQELITTMHGNVVRVDAPLLGRYPNILLGLMPWIRARLEGQVHYQVVEPPARLIYAAQSAGPVAPSKRGSD
jgi:hypothetical protein